MGDFWNPAGSRPSLGALVRSGGTAKSSGSSKKSSNYVNPNAGSLAQQYGTAVAPLTKYQTSFGKVMPEDAFLRKDILSQTAFGRVDPEIAREGYKASRTLEAGLGTSGGARFGQAGVQRQGLLDEFERQRKERARNIYDQLLASRMEEYRAKEKDYYSNPNAFTMPTLAPAPVTGYAKDFVSPTQMTKDYRFNNQPNIYQG